MGKKTHYKCGICNLKYEEEEWAEKCEKWCEKNKSCNLEITKHSIELKRRENKNGML